MTDPTPDPAQKAAEEIARWYGTPMPVEPGGTRFTIKPNHAQETIAAIIRRHLPQPAQDGGREAFEVAWREFEKLADAYTRREIAEHFWQAASSRPRALSEFVPTHRHYKGGMYQELMRCEREHDCQALVVYRDVAGRIWSRPAEEFDGKTINVSGATLAQYVRRFEPLDDRRLTGEPKP